MWLPVVFRNFRQLDEWDGVVFVGGLALGIGVVFATGLPSSMAVWAGFVLASGGIELRRLLNPSLLKKEALAPPRPASLIVILLAAFGLFGMLVALAGCFLALAALSNPGDLPLGIRIGMVCFPIVCAAIAATMIRVARRLRR